jgi:hypothetical protein
MQESHDGPFGHLETLRWRHAGQGNEVGQPQGVKDLIHPAPWQDGHLAGASVVTGVLELRLSTSDWTSPVRIVTFSARRWPRGEAANVAIGLPLMSCSHRTSANRCLI